MKHKAHNPFEGLNPEDYKTDKFDIGYLETYARLLGERCNEPLTILEMGIHQGGSLLLFRDAFPKSNIIGVDFNKIILEEDLRRISVYQGKQDDVELLEKIALKHAPDGFDLIIDDAAHIGAIARRSFWSLFPKFVKPAGIYAIEDWGTAYWEAWPDGQMPDRIGAPFIDDSNPLRFSSHDWGMAGFIKELVDEVAIQDTTQRQHGLAPEQSSLIQRMEINLGHVLVVRSQAPARH